MTFALGTPHRGQTIAPDDDRFAIKNSLNILDRFGAWEGPQRWYLWRIYAPEFLNKRSHILRERRLELHGPGGRRMHDAEAPGMECLPWKVNESNILRSIDVPLLADQRVAAQPRLQADLVAPAGHEADLDQGRVHAECLNDLVVAAGFGGTRIVRVRLALDERFLIPDKVVAPGSSGRRRYAVYESEIDSFGLVAAKLILQSHLDIRPGGEDHEA